MAGNTCDTIKNPGWINEQQKRKWRNDG